MDFPTAWAFTVSVETIALVLLLRKAYRLERLVALGIIASTVTLPFVWYVFPALISPWTWSLGLSEIFAVVVEAAIYAAALPKLGWKKALGVSLACNALSFLIGMAFW